MSSLESICSRLRSIREQQASSISQHPSHHKQIDKISPLHSAGESHKDEKECDESHDGLVIDLSVTTPQNLTKQNATRQEAIDFSQSDPAISSLSAVVQTTPEMTPMPVMNLFANTWLLQQQSEMFKNLLHSNPDNSRPAAADVPSVSASKEVIEVVQKCNLPPETSHILSKESHKQMMNRLKEYIGSNNEFNFDFMLHIEAGNQCHQNNCERSFDAGEHHHCMICLKTIDKRENVLKDIRLHEKQYKSLLYNFNRFGPQEVCIDSNCPNMLKQTHYHCCEEGCKVSFSTTSEMQVHFNGHQKTLNLKKEGFQRIHSAVMCSRTDCPFKPERTTHYHCIRGDCQYSFKNRADIEKHKGHHAKNEELAKNGFRKYFKYEKCCVDDCEFSRKFNHVHCLQKGCRYILNSVNMIPSHMRKHRKYASQNSEYHKQVYYGAPRPNNAFISNATKSSPTPNSDDQALDLSMKSTESSSSLILNKETSLNSDKPTASEDVSAGNLLEVSVLFCDMRPRSYDYNMFLAENVRRYTANDPCNARCRFLYQNHYHCLAISGHCNAVMRGKQQIREHGRRHAIMEDIISDSFRECGEKEHGDTEKSVRECSGDNLPELWNLTGHYHCMWKNCEFKCSKIDEVDQYHHVKSHILIEDNFSSYIGNKNCLFKQSYRSKVEGKKSHPSNSTGCDISKKFNKSQSPEKRNLQNDSSIEKDSPPVKRILLETDSHLPKSDKREKISDVSATVRENCFEKGNDLQELRENWTNYNWNKLTVQTFLNDQDHNAVGFKMYRNVGNECECENESCRLRDALVHFHCLRPRCHCAVDDLNGIRHHCVDFHSQVIIESGFEAFNYKMDCGRTNCLYSNSSKHYHCIIEDCCDIGFYREKTMLQHKARRHNMSVLTNFNNSITMTTTTTNQSASSAESCMEGVVSSSSNFSQISSDMEENSSSANNIFSVKKNSTEIDAQNYFSPINSCMLPFCKLKRSGHYHCDLCNVGMSKVIRLVEHLRKHQYPNEVHF